MKQQPLSTTQIVLSIILIPLIGCTNGLTHFLPTQARWPMRLCQKSHHFMSVYFVNVNSQTAGVLVQATEPKSGGVSAVFVALI